ncbi:hypothetical protein [Compostibacter hankyongensis]|uniref:Cbb3-type cytochrome c oxidase subunit I n=1 Tax=Compostibacter hankyongensis TaxID=1007089 RepID=A0ABP8FCV1_9BACT
MDNVRIGKAPPVWAVLPFFAAGTIFFLAMAVMLLLSGDSLRGNYFDPRLLAIVHTAAIGWGTMIIFGAAYQLLPVVCERDLYSPRLALLSFVLLLAGAVLLIGSFWYFRTGPLMIAGGILVVLSVLSYCINLYGTVGIFHKPDIQRLFLLSSAAWLLFTVTIGLLLAVNLAYPFIGRPHLEILTLHAHAGLAGWFLQLITSIASRLLPMFLLGKPRPGKWLQWSFLLQQTGLVLFLADSYFNGSSWRVMLYAAVFSAGIFLFMYYLYSAFRGRLRKTVDLPMKQSLFSFVFLWLAIACAPAVYFLTDSRWTVIYGLLLFCGWISGLILGQTFKTLPFIIWNFHYKAVNGKIKTPLPRDLYSASLVRWQLTGFILSLAVLGTGIIADRAMLIRSGVWLWLIVAVLYMWNVSRIFSHRIKNNTDESGHT